MTDDFSTVLWSVARKRDERTTLSIRRWRGQWFLLFAVEKLEGSGWRPTSRSVSFRPSQLAGLVEAVGRGLSLLAEMAPAVPDARQGVDS